ncbi:MAG: hypothetical protein CM15mP116_00160 [Synechococcus sp.]|nr:MAG: hypothetical protein CM15mP116_00160 [Synechococcus sp.]
MKERLELLLAQKLAQSQYGQPWSTLPPVEQRQLRSRIYREVTKELWIGTFHALFARMLRYDIDKFKDAEGLTWTKQFSIYDEADAQSFGQGDRHSGTAAGSQTLRSQETRWAISNAKNQGWLPDQLEANAEGQRGNSPLMSIGRYRKALAANNALISTIYCSCLCSCFSRTQQVRSYWHRRFRHVLVDEYQDTNRTQYDLIKLLVTDGKDPQDYDDWAGRSCLWW